MLLEAALKEAYEKGSITIKMMDYRKAIVVEANRKYAIFKQNKYKANTYILTTTSKRSTISISKLISNLDDI